MKNETMNGTVFSTILENDPQLLTAAGTLIIILLVLLWFFIKTLRSLDSGKNRQTKISEKQRLKKLDDQVREEEIIREKHSAEKLVMVSEKEDQFKAELRTQEVQLKQSQMLQKDLSDVEDEVVEEPPSSFLEQFKRGISKTRDHFLEGIGNAIYGKREIDDEVLDELEEVLLGADLGPETSQRILNSITEKVERKELKNPETLKEAIKIEISRILEKPYNEVGTDSAKPLVILLVGVNGVGKTTTIGKIASQYVHEGKKVLMGAGDTFRAAAIEQLSQWAEKAGCEIVTKEAGSDPSAVMYESVTKAMDGNYDVVICDTAGRLHTKKNLMEELKKMVRVIKKQIPEAPHQVLLVLDATTGQNAIFQTREFLEVAELTGLVVTKLDSTAKGGVIIGIVNEFDVPVRYVGMGEKIQDLRPFDPGFFIDSLFG